MTYNESFNYAINPMKEVKPSKDDAFGRNVPILLLAALVCIVLISVTIIAVAHHDTVLAVELVQVSPDEQGNSTVSLVVAGDVYGVNAASLPRLTVDGVTHRGSVDKSGCIEYFVPAHVDLSMSLESGYGVTYTGVDMDAIAQGVKQARAEVLQGD